MFVSFGVLLAAVTTVTSQQGPVFTEEAPAEVFFPNTKGISLTCSAQGVPLPTVTWTTLSDRARIQSRGGLRMLSSTGNNSTLTLLAFRPEQYRHDVHATAYRCVASNSIGTTVSRTTILHAVVLQNYEVGVSDVPGTVNEPAVFSCDVPPSVARQTRVLHWSVDGKVISPSIYPDGRYWALPTGELVLQEVKETDVYSQVSCIAAHQFDQMHRASNIATVILAGESILSRPQLLLRKDWIRPAVGTELLFPCVAKGHPKPTITWYKEKENGQKETLVQNDSRSRISVMQGHLIFSKVLKEDSGSYICVANNTAGTDSYGVQMEAILPLTASLQPRHQRGDIEHGARMTCHVSGSPLSSIQWMKDGRLLTPMPRITTYGNSLHISQVTREDRGMYQCLIRNEWDSVQGTAQLDLGDSAPVLEYRFISQTLQPGPSVSLKCIASGTPTPQIAWVVDGFTLNQGERLVVGQYVTSAGNVVSHLNVSMVKSEDGGTYSCSASNRAGTAVHQARLNVYDGRTLPFSARQHVYENGTLVVREIQKKSDSGEYTCTAVDKQGHSHSSSANVKVLIPPKLSHFTFRDDLTLGDRVSVQCNVHRGDDPLIIQWWKDSTPASDIPSVQVHQYDIYTSGLTISQLRPHHAGNYTCRAQNEAAVVTHTETLSVNVPPSIVPFHFGEASAGERVQVICSVRKGDPPIAIAWLRNGESLDLERVGVSVSLFDQFSSVLLVEHLTVEHSANYTCLASNGAKTVAHSSALIVKVPPYWIEAPHDVSANKGSNVVIPCQASGFPTPKVSWRKANKNQSQYTPIITSLYLDSSKGVNMFSNGSLLVQDATENDEGKYICVASNGVGVDISLLITVTVNAPPEFDTSIPVSIAARKKSPAILTCAAIGDLPISLEWTADYPRSSIITPKNRVTEVADGIRGELTIPSVDTSHAGPYLCTATNNFGSRNVMIHLTVQDVPSAPRGLRLSEKGSRHLMISWLSDAGSALPVEKYIIHFKEAEGSWTDPQMQEVEGNEKRAKLFPLRPATSYLVRVVASNHLGESSSSEPLQVTTDGEQPSGSPESVRAEALSHLSVKVYWTSPLEKSIHGTLLGYSVGLKEFNSLEDVYNYTVVSVGGSLSMKEEIISGLKAWTAYSVVVRAYNAYGSGPMSPAVTVRTLQDVPSSPPENVICSPGATSSTLVIRWNPPPTENLNGVLQGYKLSLFTVDMESDEVDEISRTSNSREEIVGGLKAWTNYTINIAAMTQAGIGVASSDLTCSTKETVPGPPAGLKALQSGLKSATLSWLPPQPMNGQIMEFILHHQPPRTHTVSQYPVGPEETIYEVDRLQSGSHTFWVTGKTKFGEGPSSEIARLVLVDNAPGGVASWDKKIVVPYNQDVRLHCITVGMPAPEPGWKKDGVEIFLKRNVYFDDDTLVIRDIQKQDEGNYTCFLKEGRNGGLSRIYSYISATFSVFVQVPPSPPIVTLQDATSSTLIVSWVPKETGGATISGWEVWWKQLSTPTGSVWRSHQLGRTQQKYVISELHCGTEYQVYVTAKTHIGVSAPSRAVTGKTEGNPPIPPPAHQVASSNETSVVVWLGRWRDNGCPVSHYTLELKPSYESKWSTLASSLAPQESYEFSQRSTTDFILRLTAHNAAGATTTTVVMGRPGDPRPVETIAEGSLASSFPGDLRVLISAAASVLAFTLSVAAIILCFKRRSAVSTTHISQESDLESQENKANFMHQRDPYYHTIRKGDSSISTTLDRIPEHSEDIYPYATFHMRTREPSQSGEDISNFQTFIYSDSRYGITEGQPLPPSESSGYGKVRRSGRGESEEYDSFQSDSETERPTSSRTESSFHLENTTLESRAKFCAAADGSDSQPLSHHHQNMHHNLLYHAPDSSTSTETSPMVERKSFPRKFATAKVPSSSRSFFDNYALPAKSKQRGMTKVITPPANFCEISEAECDLEARKVESFQGKVYSEGNKSPLECIKV